ncbi:MAG: PAS domain S-box protein, partial [Proteobacteria bacterium]|nr:PAS domain S-box protein [Pseudomonadota bacterium]
LQQIADGGRVSPDRPERPVDDHTAQPSEPKRELEQAIAERNRAEHKFRDLLESAPDAMVLVGRSGMIVSINEHTETMFGYSGDEILGRPIETLIPQRFLQGHADHVKGYFANPLARPMGMVKSGSSGTSKLCP